MKAKMGRPKLPKAEARNIVLSIRVNAEENTSIEKAAKDAGKDISEWARNLMIETAQKR